MSAGLVLFMDMHTKKGVCTMDIVVHNQQKSSLPPQRDKEVAGSCNKGLMAGATATLDSVPKSSAASDLEGYACAPKHRVLRLVTT